MDRENNKDKEKNKKKKAARDAPKPAKQPSDYKSAEASGKSGQADAFFKSSGKGKIEPRKG